ncbi:serine--tRNA ligase [Patescibacteria group bacterium]|nr:serine--tRNA ligase [Patescibacteria group bacterium]MBU0776888.1 serine--tRNA ligase [Patescibacteria group bacterium]MBU0846233.1 serine--tRNA ligase [Patescibacteria group bacterium]MBU0922580.1 serine--tRNA ligase [Patescibacteria group bacterium]MBU1066631.1 serine--tRNA ligase [Patescibacteria group bacterium]
MIDINYIRENPEKVKKGIEAKQLDPKRVDEVLELDKKRRELLSEIETLRADRNRVAKEQDKEKGKEIKTKLQKLEPELAKIEKEYKEKLYQIPNLPADDVKTGKDESENEVIREWGEKKKSSAKDYLELGEDLDIIDIKRAAKVSGSRFGYLKGDGALLELALVQLAMEFLVKEGFTPVIPPSFIKRESMRGMGYLEHGGEEDMYVFEKDDLVLVGTSEQSIGPMHMDEVLEEKNLPKRYVSFSPCFRREAGSYGKDTKGILRVHQFDKVEMFSFTKPGDSEKEHEYLLSLEEKFFQALEIPYQVVKMCSGDLGAPAAKKYDLEAWMPGQGKYVEVTSTSNATDFQARRLNIKYQDKGETKFVHTLNGTAFAIGRTIIAIIENYQQKDGSILIPDVLQKWVGKEKITK